FERFYRLHGDQHNSGVIGCGLGLTIVKHIVDLHHAHIQLGTSAWGHGLKVDVIFPLRAVNYA
ncbi:ATP-binding protein, partial [Methylophaga sp. UBA3996]